MCAALRLTFKRRWYKIRSDVQKFKSLVISCAQFANQLFKQRDYIVSTSAIKTVREFRQKIFIQISIVHFTLHARPNLRSRGILWFCWSKQINYRTWTIGKLVLLTMAYLRWGDVSWPPTDACARFSRRLMIKSSICYTCCALAPMHKYSRFIWVASTFSEASLGN